MLNEIKPPLLSLYLCYSDNIPIKIYKEVLTNFEELWGMHLHVLSQNVRNNANINKFMELVKTFDKITYSFGEGIINNQIHFTDLNAYKNMQSEKFRTLEIIVNKELINNIKYCNYIKDIINNDINLELYFRANKQNLDSLDNIVKFCNLNNIKICIIDIDKRNSINKITGIEYKKALDLINLINMKKRVKLSVAECPYLNIQDNKIQKMLGGCSGGITSGMIDENGNFIMCYYLKELSFGNIMNTSLTKIWNENILLNKIRNRKNIKGKCSKCKYLFCCGGCRAESYFTYKDLFNEDTNCWIH